MKDFETFSVPRLPAMHKGFAVGSHASNQGIYSALLQYFADVTFPLAYASRKLNVAEGRYSTIAGNGLTVVFANSKLRDCQIVRKFIWEWIISSWSTSISSKKYPRLLDEMGA